MKVSENLHIQWKKDEQVPFKGWDFSYLTGRMIEEQLPWDYASLAKDLVRSSTAVLDMGTGGGEIFYSLAPFPKHTIAIEGWQPNVAVARKRLTALGVKVLKVDESYDLPFKNGEFDLVLNRHSAFKAKEMFRILKSKGIFLTQQVGGGNLNDLIAEFGTKPQFKDWTIEKITKQLTDAGLKVEQSKDWKGKVEFKDVGAIVYFLKAIPWVVEGFKVDKYLPVLEFFQKKLDRGNRLIFSERRFLVQAKR